MFKKFILSNCICVLAILSLCPNVYSASMTIDKSVEIKKLSLTPAAEPVPALSYKLLPHYIDQKTGNAALFYYSAAGLLPDGDSKDIHEKINDWLDLPADQIDRREAEKVLSSFSNCFRQIKLATQCNSCQWEMPVEEGYSMLMPQLGGFRNIIRAMGLKTKLYIADDKIDQAMEMLQQGIYMGRNIAEGPTVIQGLVGISIEGLMLNQVEGLIQNPDSPNMYWALSSLPYPMIDMHSSIQFEREMIFFEFPQLRDLENVVLSPQQASKMISEIFNKIQELGAGSDSLPFNGILSTALVMIHYSDAKKYLTAKGFSQQRIEAMPAAQAVLIYQKQQYLEIADSMFKWLELPYDQAQPYIRQNKEQFNKSISGQGIKVNILTSLLPALDRVAFIQARLDRNISMLRTIEAIRMFAAGNSGKLPESLSEITLVPIPKDPVTGKDFIYDRIDNRNARLEAPVLSEENDKRPIYELTLKQ